MKVCYSCGQQIEIIEKINRRDTCKNCRAYLRICRNCCFYSESSHNKCKETQAEWVQDKDKANYCEYFVFSERPDSSISIKGSGNRKEFDNLFRK